jgi:hypothetical protein
MKKMSGRTFTIILIHWLLVFTGFSVNGNQMNTHDTLTMDSITENAIH